MRSFQGIVVMRTQTSREISKSELVYLQAETYWPGKRKNERWLDGFKWELNYIYFETDSDDASNKSDNTCYNKAHLILNSLA